MIIEDRELMWARSLAEEAKNLAPEAVALRRDLHRHPERGFFEYRTASILIERLSALGFTVEYGADVMDADAIHGLPPHTELERELARAYDEGVDPALLKRMEGGFTGVVATIEGEGGEGKTVAFRFDMDANDVTESQDVAHRPVKEGFRSLYNGGTHACGHDGHVAIGLTLARLLSMHRKELRGRIKLIFQPAEEGVRGAAPMVAAGVADDVDVLLSGHIGIAARENDMIVSSVGGFLAVKKYKAVFTGKSSHAGLAPDEGRNALLAAAQAALALHAIPRHGKGKSRINVGTLMAGSGTNVIPDHAEIKLEVRGETTAIRRYMEGETERILRAAAEMYGVSVEISTFGEAGASEADPILAEEILALAEAYGYGKVLPYADMNASEDATEWIEHVRARGGRGGYVLYGASLAAGHHNGAFDFDESVLWRTAGFLCLLATHYGA